VEPHIRSSVRSREDASAGYPDLTAMGAYGRFDLLGRLAYGGMAEIFLARESGAAGSSRQLVIKRVLPHVVNDKVFVGMFEDEARLAMRLNHPNICHIYEFGEAEGTYFIAMEWINGVDVRKLVRRASSDGGVPVEYAARIFSDVAGALHYAHNATDEVGRPLRIVHRDVSPQNVMVSFDGVPKLLDFGIAKAATHVTKTSAGVVKGKFAYMAPEQCLGKEIDERADVFALGICMYESLVGKTLFGRKTEVETMRAILEGEPPPPPSQRRPDVPPALDSIIMGALARSRRDRWQSAADVQLALERFLVDARQPVRHTQLSDYLRRLFQEDIQRGPVVDSTLFGPPKRRGGSASASFGSGRGGSVRGSGLGSGLSSASGLSEEQMEVLGEQADREAAQLTRAHARRLVLLGVVFLVLVVAVLAIVFSQAGEGVPGASQAPDRHDAPAKQR